MFQHRPELMRSIPHFLQGPFHNALLMALEEASHPEGARKERGWKLFIYAVAKVAAQTAAGQR